MNSERYTLNKVILRFRDRATERAYAECVLNRTINFARVAWGSVIFLGASFAILDRDFFGENANTVLLARVVLFALAAGVIAASYSPKLMRLLENGPALFVLFVGSFCILTIGLSDPTEFSPYFSGLFLGFAGIFCTPGLGFRRAVLALLADLALFELVVLILAPVSPELNMTYQIFMLGAILVFALASYLVERASRESFVVSEELRDSLAQVKKLSGLLPICASCKSVRDDKGYWEQIELYIQSRSEAEFSHGICPDCAKRLYPEYPLAG